MSSTLCLGAGATLVTLILACKRVLRQSCQSCQSISQSSKDSSSLALKHPGRRSGRHRLDSALPHIQLKYFDRLSLPIAAKTPPPPSTRQRNATQLHHLNTTCRMRLSSMDTSPNSQNGGQSFYTQPPPLSNPPPRIFGNISASGSPIPPTLPGPIFTNDDGSVENDGEQGDPKRRRIARVCCLRHTKLLLLTRAYRHAICVERKKSSVTANFQPVRIARIIRQSVSLHR